METPTKQFKISSLVGFLCSLVFFNVVLHAGRNDVLGEIKFAGASNVEKTSGVWVDGLYLGYLKELKKSKKILLLPGEHEIAVRQAGYKEFTQKVVVEPGLKQIVQVSMEKDPEARYPKVTSEIKLSVRPKRAAVFLDDRFVGHVDEFEGVGHGMLLDPGKHRIKIALPGFQTFETEVNLLPNQKFQLKTDLFWTSIAQAGPLIKER